MTEDTNDEVKRYAVNEFLRATKQQEEKVNWNYYVCRGCNRYGDAHMVSLQARLELCDGCYGTLPKNWRVKRGEQP